MNTTQPNSPEQILRWWQSRYGRLTSDQQQRFLQRNEVKHLARTPPNTVLKALDSSPKLVNILTAARIIQASYKQTARELVAGWREADQRRSNRKPTAQRKPRSTTRRAWVEGCAIDTRIARSRDHRQRDLSDAGHLRLRARPQRWAPRSPHRLSVLLVSGVRTGRGIA